MSKSLGNFVTLQTLIDKSYDPLDYRYFLLMAHYRKKLKFSNEAMEAAKSGYKNLKNRINKLRAMGQLNGDAIDDISVGEWRNKFLNVINDDLNMPEAMAVMWDMLRDGKLSSTEKLNLTYDFDRIFGLELNVIKDETTDMVIPDEINLLAGQRTEAKKNKNFKLADEIRDRIREKGFEILDKKDGSEIKKII